MTSIKSFCMARRVVRRPTLDGGGRKLKWSRCISNVRMRWPVNVFIGNRNRKKSSGVKRQDKSAQTVGPRTGIAFPA